uniref:Uncharacterized protein n=1 Tax=Ascaris lumbricoides TaxID=6252 RepID=A0A0M3HWW4_ASCLU
MLEPMRLVKVTLTCSTKIIDEGRNLASRTLYVPDAPHLIKDQQHHCGCVRVHLTIVAQMRAVVHPQTGNEQTAAMQTAPVDELHIFCTSTPHQ